MGALRNALEQAIRVDTRADCDDQYDDSAESLAACFDHHAHSAFERDGVVRSVYVSVSHVVSLVLAALTEWPEEHLVTALRNETYASAHPLVHHACRELDRLGEDRDSPYVQSLINAIAAFEEGQHSGASHALGVDVLSTLLRNETLTRIDDDPDSWTDHSKISGSPIWQSTRDPSIFSKDGGKTYWRTRNPAAIFTSEVTGKQPDGSGTVTE